jgi:carotenoid cleavage dioxygenase
MPLSRRDFLGIAALSGASLPWMHLVGFAVDTDPQFDTTSPFLQGNFAPVHEEVTVENLRVIGQLPGELRGMFVRNGPNPQFAPIGKYHWFDGDGMLHGVRLGDGKASYRNRYVQTAGWREEHAAGKALWTGLAMPPDLTKLTQGKPLFKNAANTALVWHDGRLLALWEGGEPHEIDVPDLNTIGPYTYDGKLRHPFTAHPKVDAATGEMMLFGYSALSPFVQYSVVNADGERMRTVPVKLRRPVMMHDFAVTEHYSIFMDLPVVTSMVGLERGESMMRYAREMGSRFGILPRHGKHHEIKWFESPSCYVFHTLNAYEDGDEVVLLACRMPEFSDISGPPTTSRNVNAMPMSLTPALYEWRFNLVNGETKEKPCDDLLAEFPRVNDALLGRRTRFGYALGLAMGDLLKYDLANGTSQKHPVGEGRFAGEAVFVARPDAKGEDDGWLVTYVFDQSSETSELIVVDAQDFTAGPLARVLLPVRVPFGFHGIWLGEEQLV